MKSNPSRLEPLLTEHQVAEISRMSVASIRRWRRKKQGPKYLKVGAAVRYRPEDLYRWLETRPTGGQTD
jgi:predicted DNA-binding transcriptional regulator AlpA